ncbi:spermatogenesis-associated protein 31D1-like isoform X2 [Heterocephalus glaber]|uniref:Spermatogenesis-associated protein 31D1-like isoform X2 n=1 Tax=Heterocephalus glaber TaxID=10181 RepID=A0AAX6RL47_HETGA|nr:spermatogenesis-associated protein 31D1-like isoform X2 [Heterocephalus glaber]
MENVFSFLNSHTEPQLNFGSTFLDTDPNYTFLTAVGWLSLLVLCYLFLKSHLPALWKDKDIQKRQVRAKRRTRSRTVRSWRTSQREAEEERKLLSILTSFPGQHHDITHFRQLLCADPSVKCVIQQQLRSVVCSLGHPRKRLLTLYVTRHPLLL